MKELESYYYCVEMPKVRQGITEFKKEIGNQGKCKRLSYLYDRLMELDLELIERKRRYRDSMEQDRPYIERQLIASYIPEVEKEIQRFEKEINFIVNERNGRITQEMIEQAREYPIENLINVRRNMAVCPFHNDKQPSLSIKHNRFYCFGCHAKGDVIEFLMRRDGLSFKEAVNFLTEVT